MFELITAPFIILCVLVAIAFFIGMKVGADNYRNKNDYILPRSKVSYLYDNR